MKRKLLIQKGSKVVNTGALEREMYAQQLDIRHPCYGQLTAVKIAYPLTSVYNLFIEVTLTSCWISIDRWLKSIHSGGIQFASLL